MIIKTYEPDDFDDLVRLSVLNRTYVGQLDRWGYIRPASAEAYGRKTAESFVKEVDDDHGLILIAKEGDGVIGCGMVIIVEPDELIKLRHKDNYQRYGYIKNVFVDEAYRVQGVGSAIVQKLEEHAKSKGCHMIWLEVFEPNVNAHKLYEGLGYEDLSRIMIKKID